MGINVIARCVNCREEKVVSPGEVDKDDVPMCDKCFSPMVADRVVSKEKSNERN